MKLPQDLQPHFPHAALIIASSHMDARFFLAGGENLEELDGISEPREKRQDSEGTFASDVEQVADENFRYDHFVRSLAARANDLVTQHGIAHILLAMPADIEHAFTKELPNAAKPLITRKVELDLMKEDPLEIIRRLFA